MPTITPLNWTWKAQGTPAEVSAALSAQQGTIEQNVRYGMQTILDNASGAVPPAVSCIFSASQVTTVGEGNHVSRVIDIQLKWNN
jgi:hypothetical protein